jgi:hypothetical protein
MLQKCLLETPETFNIFFFGALESFLKNSIKLSVFHFFKLVIKIHINLVSAIFKAAIFTFQGNRLSPVETEIETKRGF